MAQIPVPVAINTIKQNKKLKFSNSIRIQKAMDNGSNTDPEVDPKTLHTKWTFCCRL